VSGVVVDDQNVPVRRASVIFEGDARANRVVLTDDKGAFIAANLPPARYTIRAERAGFASGEYGAKRAGRPGAGLTIKDGDKVENVTLHMARGAVITGRILDERGRPVVGAGVSVFRSITRLGGEVEFQLVSANGGGAVLSDDRGIYRVYGLSADEYVIGVQSFRTGQTDAARRPTDAELREVFGQTGQRSSRAINTDARAAAPAAPPVVNLAPMFFGDTTDALASTRIKLATGEERVGVDLHLPWQPRATISVVVSGPDVTPPTVEFEVRPRQSVGGLAQFLVRPGVTGGRASFPNQAPGDYIVVARTVGAPTPMWGEAPVTVVDRDVTDVRIELRPALILSGRLVFQGATPPDPARFLVTLPPTKRTGRTGSGGTAVTADATFALRDVQPCACRLNVVMSGANGAPTWTMTSVMMGERDVTDLPLDIADGQPLPPLTITMTDTPSELSGRITVNGKPGADVFVVVLSADERYWIYGTRRIKSARPDATGRYVFNGLPPGAYRVAAVTELDQGDLQNPQFLRDLVGASAEVIVGVSEKKVLDLKLQGSTLDLKVQDSTLDLKVQGSNF
jgi:hypothetical protein